MRSASALCTVTAAILTASCSASIPRSQATQPSSLVLATCGPGLAPLTDDTFGATTDKLLEVTARFYACRAAALAGSTPAP